MTTSPTAAPPAIESEPKPKLPVVQPDGPTNPAEVLPTATDDTSTTGTDGSSTTSTTVVIVVVALVVVALLGAVALLVSFGAYYLSRRQRTKATDFHLEIQKMLEINEIDEATVDKAAIPVEIPRRNVNVITKIGSGQFGDVCKATYTDPSGAEFLVAVKTVRDTAASVEATNEIKFEATVMAQVGSHPNLVSLVGVVTRGDPLLLVLSYCELGSLLSMLKAAARSGRPVELTEKIDFAVGTAAGMEHLCSKHFVHRDLAARNVLVTTARVCKVADFGLSRTVAPTKNGAGDDENPAQYYKSSHGVFPIRWTAPEATENLKFSAMTDVWSFGIVMIELISDGAKPYQGMSNSEVLLKVQTGYTIPQPPGCPDDLWNRVIAPCWVENPLDRPSFAQLGAALGSVRTEMVGSPRGLVVARGRGELGESIIDDIEYDMPHRPSGAARALSNMDAYAEPIAMATPDRGSRAAAAAGAGELGESTLDDTEYDMPHRASGAESTASIVDAHAEPVVMAMPGRGPRAAAALGGETPYDGPEYDAATPTVTSAGLPMETCFPTQLATQAADAEEAQVAISGKGGPETATADLGASMGARSTLPGGIVRRKACSAKDTLKI